MFTSQLSEEFQTSEVEECIKAAQQLLVNNEEVAEEIKKDSYGAFHLFEEQVLFFSLSYLLHFLFIYLFVYLFLSIVDQNCSK